MLRQVYHKETKEFEYVDEGGANAKGVRDFGRLVTKQSAVLGALVRDLRRGSTYSNKHLINAIKDKRREKKRTDRQKFMEEIFSE